MKRDKTIRGASGTGAEGSRGFMAWIMGKLRSKTGIYGRMIKFEHSIFALPFALSAGAISLIVL